MFNSIFGKANKNEKVEEVNIEKTEAKVEKTESVEIGFDDSEYAIDGFSDSEYEEDTTQVNGNESSQISGIDDFSDDEYYTPVVDTNEQFSEEEYKKEETKETEEKPIENIEITDKNFKHQLDQIAKRGEVMVVTGLEGSGTSSLAFNLASILSKVNHKVLIVDLDTELKSQHIMSAETYNSMDISSDNIKRTLENDVNHAFTYVTLVKKNLHLLGTGIACEPFEITDEDEISKLLKMIEMFKKEYDYVICDIPLKQLVKGFNDLINRASDIVLSIDSSTIGLINTLNVLCNIDNEYLLDSIFSNKTSIVYNKMRVMKDLLGKSINLASKRSLDVIDKVVTEFAGYEISYKFSNMRLVGYVPYINDYEKYVNSHEQFCDNGKGRGLLMQLLKNILVK